MKLRLICSGMFALLFATSCYATTLRLDPNIDLLVLDGRKISGSLLKGADGLELDNGEHQLLFRVEKVLDTSHGNAKRSYISAPLIVTFVANVKSISIRLPALESLRDRRQFDKNSAFILVDEKGRPVESRRDRLPLLDGPQTDLEKALMAYNRNGQVASVPRFAQQPPLSMHQDKFPVDALGANMPAERLLQLWFHQVDSATRQRLVSWMKALRPS
ncbi:hypothetical protein COO59_01220 [Mixta theicola]|uniref:UPF0319 protein COO59_01220 n=1 Tax=Mixta theicola TaxID=1458355 RepID=A0A2K1QEK7_9GAMM|nr:DUF2057 family protein [Mixta theicola]PNS13461.1 hypothetical protein COO59_01220 [Mixta theicola]GLR09777.1 UPF0319 protein [Mixta theicola]